MSRATVVLTDPPRLCGSRDTKTGDVFFPARALAIDGSLRACEPFEIGDWGILYSWTRFGNADYGQIDMPEGVRVQARLEAADHLIGAKYKLIADEEGKGINWRFRRA